MDMQMPEMDGATAARLLREAGCTLPIVALTANAMKGFEHSLEGAGFSGWLTKPIDVDALMHALAERLGGRRAAPAAAPAPQGPPLAVPAAAGPLVSRLSGQARLAAIVARFVLQLSPKLVEMDTACARGDFAELARLAHWLKGAGGSMGYDELFEPSKRLEEAAHAGDGAAARTILGELSELERRIHLGAAAQSSAETLA
jgi:DNA-binding response OmpR family regulator